MCARVTRLAPSPTGALHLGNVRTFLINWAAARQGGWRVLLRIEDLDGPRLKAGASAQAIDLLQWLGLDWDGPPLYQSHDLQQYHAALTQLDAADLTYPCAATRQQIEAAASAPHGSDDEHDLRYPGLYRPPHTLPLAEGAATAIRLKVPDGPVVFSDELQGPQAIDVQAQIGDFILETKAGLPAYQLAVVVDDARQGVTEVVRGDDLLASAARQVLLYQFLELGPPPRYFHLPLVYGPDGLRLAKRHGDTRLQHYRNAGLAPERIIGLVAYWSGALPQREPMTAAEFCNAFRWDRLPLTPVTFTPEDDAWLCA